MKKLTLLSLFLIGILLSVSAQHPEIGGYNVYYGNLHNHSTVSDGFGTPSVAYNTAKNTGLDFFGLGDHDYSIEASEYTLTKNAANSYNQDGVFTTFYGFEWSSNGEYGHILVINSDDYCKANNSATNTFDELRAWMSSRECIAFFNHPGREDWTGKEFDHFTDVPDDKFVGIELWNKTVGFDTYYYNDGYYSNDGNKGYWEEGLARNWKLGAGGAEDHHGLSWGSGDYSMAILADNLTRTDLYNAMKARRFYSTMDKNIALSFKLDGNEMGSTIESGTINLQVQASDGNGETFTKVMLFKNGIENQTWNISTSSVNQTASISTASGDFYYVKVTQADGGEAISSPIWIEGNPVIWPPIQTVTARISTGTDDVEESPIGCIYDTSSDLELVNDAGMGGNQTIGLRYPNLNIPKAAIISKAYLKFTCDEPTSETCNLTISGHDIDNSPAFTITPYNVSGRTKTSAKINWSPPAWKSAGESRSEQQSPDISSVVQEIVNRPGYTSNSAISVIINGTGKRVAEAYEGSTTGAALIYVEYVEPIQTIEISQRISSSINDVEEAPDGYIYSTSSDIELTNDSYVGGDQKIGLRYTGMGIPQGATINSAYLQFTCDEPTSGTCNLSISGHDIDNSPVFTTSQYNVSNRTKTSARINWNPPAWKSAGESRSEQLSPNIGSVVQEIVNRAGYTSNSAITLLIDGTGNRTAESYDGQASAAAELIINYSSYASSTNQVTLSKKAAKNNAGKQSGNANSISDNYVPHETISSNNSSFKNDNDVLVYPNPVSSSFVYIQVNEVVNDMHIRLFDISGKMLIHQAIESTNTEISVADLESGLFIIQVTTGTETLIQKLIIE